jgi:hypothetical protein
MVGIEVDGIDGGDWIEGHGTLRATTGCRTRTAPSGALTLEVGTSMKVTLRAQRRAVTGRSSPLDHGAVGRRFG